MIDIAIIGGGPAGLAAGLYAARGGAKAILFEEIYPGGQVARTDIIENYPGFENGVAGAELGMRLEAQAMRFGLQIEGGSVEELMLDGDEKRIRVNGEILSARTVILATGASPRMLGLPEEQALIGAGVSYCATCDGAFFRNRRVAVIGGGDTALSDALYLARFVEHVLLVHRRDELRGSKQLQQAVFAEPKIEMAWSQVPDALLGQGMLTGIRLKSTKDGTLSEHPINGLFVAVGILPRTELFMGQVELAENGHVETDKHMQTSLRGVYAAGDVRNTPLRQVVTAVADGAVAATSALEFLAS